MTKGTQRFLEIEGALYNIDHIVSIKPVIEYEMVDGRRIGKAINEYVFKLTDGSTVEADWSWEGVQDSLEGFIIHDDEE